MCFTVNVNLIKEELENRYGATLIHLDKYRPSYYYHAFGLPSLPAILSHDPSKIHLLQWGLIPSWTKDIEQANIIRYKTFNARSETVAAKPAYSSSFRTNRCIIPVAGFFEWQHVGNEKIPWYICHSGNEILSLAGIYTDWIENNTGEKYSTFSVITTEANKLMAEIHNSGKRMPVILNREAEARWIDISTTQDEAQSLLVPYPSDILHAHTISPLINSRSENRNTPELLLPYTYHSDNLLF
jgi:putative SOS response-associated peptidase YedK